MIQVIPAASRDLVCSLHYKLVMDNASSLPSSVPPQESKPVTSLYSKTYHSRFQAANLMQRILRLQYKIPENGEVSDQLRDLLSKILVDNPQERLSMKEIQQHPWYLQDLPEGVMDMNNELPLPGDDVQVHNSL